MINKLLKTLIVVVLLLLSTSVYSKALNAKFSFSVNCRTITLVDSSTGTVSIDRYYWDFGDGSYSSSASNTHTYKFNGYYRVLLVIATNDSSQSDYNDSAEMLITINCTDCNVYAYFNYNMDLMKDNKINFQNLSGQQNNYASVWDFGYTGNAGSTLRDPEHTFPSSGYYAVKLKVSYYDTIATKNCSDSITLYVQTKQLLGRFDYSIDSVNCRKVTFNDSSVNVPDSIQWFFGDGDMGTGNTVTHEYASNYRYLMMYLAFRYDSTLGRSVQDSISQWIDLTNCNACLVKAVILLDGDSTKPFSGTLYNYSSGSIHRHHWDFGDGGTSSQVAPVHTYAGPGSYTITYIATDTIKNCSDTDRVSFKIDSLGYLKRKAFTLTVVDRTTAIKKVMAQVNQPFQLYPNPTQNFINISSAINQELRIYNVLGHQLNAITINANEAQQIDVSAWSKGLYFVVNGQGESLKFVVE